jgi:DNA polymerase III, subunit gamma and tau
MLYNKMRPHAFKGIIGQEVIVKSLQSQSQEDRFFNLYILEGQYGSGKTTTARILALAANCRHKDNDGNPCLECEQCQAILSGNCRDYMEIDAASNTGVEKARLLIEDVSYVPTFLKRKIYIIDEAHMLSKAAFNCLLKTLEESPEYAIFILCTTDRGAIPLTIQSRAATYTFRRIPEEAVTEYLKETCRREYPSIETEQEALAIISANSNGSMRDALSLLEQAATYREISQANVRQMLGVADSVELLNLTHCLAKKELPKCIAMARYLISGGKQLPSMATGMLSILQDAAIVSVSGDPPLISGSSAYRQSIQNLASLSDSGHLCHMIKNIMLLQGELQKNPTETLFTSSLATLCLTEEDNSMGHLEKRLDNLESGINTLRECNTHTSMPIKKEEKLTETGIAEDDAEGMTPAPKPEPACPASSSGTDSETQKAPFFTNEDLFQMFAITESFSGQAPKEEPKEKQEASPCAKGIDNKNEITAITQEQDKTEVISETARETIALIDEIKEQYPAFCSAIEEGSKRQVKGDIVKYLSPLQPICSLLAKFFENFNIPAQACFSPDTRI